MEFGCGESGFSVYAKKMGFSVTIIDMSYKSCKIQSQRAEKFGLDIDIVNSDTIPLKKQYDILCSFEVIEHVEDDMTLLRNFHDCLKQNGVLIISVPACMKKWTYLDDITGHFRRYERIELFDKLSKAGFADIEFYNRGFPAETITHGIEAFFRRIFKHFISIKSNKTSQTKHSGSADYRKFNWLIKPVGIMMLPVISLQTFFKKTDFGEGFVVKASVKGKVA